VLEKALFGDHPHTRWEQVVEQLSRGPVFGLINGHTLDRRGRRWARFGPPLFGDGSTSPCSARPPQSADSDGDED
jgi:hypothetical protein